MTAPANQTVLFNMPRQESTTKANGWSTTSFEPTPPMASYLVAFIVGNLTGVSQNVPTSNGVGKGRPVSIYGIPERFPPQPIPSLLSPTAEIVSWAIQLTASVCGLKASCLLQTLITLAYHDGMEALWKVSKRTLSPL